MEKSRNTWYEKWTFFKHVLKNRCRKCFTDVVWMWCVFELGAACHETAWFWFTKKVMPSVTQEHRPLVHKKTCPTLTREDVFFCHARDVSVSTRCPGTEGHLLVLVAWRATYVNQNALSGLGSAIANIIAWRSAKRCVDMTFDFIATKRELDPDAYYFSEESLKYKEIAWQIEEAYIWRN